ncbi:MAG: TlpA family protein disulfide reductase [Lewinellaceae bacterium]|nr:TlpA family protein disulfide reductase [Lewinellaceae bacterium]
MGSWCGPCRAENPQLVGLYQKFQPKGFDILSIGIETNEARWKNAIERDGMIGPTTRPILNGLMANWPRFSM